MSFSLFNVVLLTFSISTLLEKTKLARKFSDGKNEIPLKFLGRKI